MYSQDRISCNASSSVWFELTSVVAVRKLSSSVPEKKAGQRMDTGNGTIRTGECMVYRREIRERLRMKYMAKARKENRK